MTVVHVLAVILVASPTIVDAGNFRDVLNLPSTTLFVALSMHDIAEALNMGVTIIVTSDDPFCTFYCKS